MKENSLLQQAEVLGELFIHQGIKIVTAESCTGGGLAKILTEIPGSSSWFERGFVTYSNESKMELLGVHEHSLIEYGAVSEQVASEMAKGALEKSNADVAISITGIAGPSGGTEEKPVGTVYLSWFMMDKIDLTKCFHFDGSRAAIRRQSCIIAINTLIDLLDS